MSLISIRGACSDPYQMCCVEECPVSVYSTSLAVCFHSTRASFALAIPISPGFTEFCCRGGRKHSMDLVNIKEGILKSFSKFLFLPAKSDAAYFRNS